MQEKSSLEADSGATERVGLPPSRRYTALEAVVTGTKVGAALGAVVSGVFAVMIWISVMAGGWLPGPVPQGLLAGLILGGIVGLSAASVISLVMALKGSKFAPRLERATAVRSDASSDPEGEPEGHEADPTPFHRSHKTG